MNQPRWLVFLSLALGVAAGLTFSWVVPPARAPDDGATSLRADYKDQLREAIAAAYATTGDLERARVRLQLLGDADTIQALTAQAQRALASGQTV